MRRLSQKRSAAATKAGLCLGLAFAFVVAALAPSGARTSAPQTSPEVPVSILLTAVDKDEKFVTTLRPEDLRVVEDGAERALTGLRRQSDNPALKKQGVEIAYPHGYFAGNASHSIKN